MPMLRRYLRLRHSEQQLHSVERLDLFSDAVLAIAATLLVLSLNVPDVIGRGGIRHVLESQRYTFLAILIGFLEVGGSWVMSRRLTRITAHVDHWLTLIWLAAIFTVTLIPFTTLLLARSIGHPDFGIAVMCVSVVTWLALAFSTVAIAYVRRAGLLRPQAEPIYGSYLRMVLIADVVWTLAIPLSLVLPAVTLAVLVLGYATGLSPLVTEGRDLPADPPIPNED